MKRYDHVVVGAGAAGCVLANRLSRDPRTRVLLLEAGGGDRSPLLRIPAGFAKLMGTKVNWLFDTVPQRHLDGRRIFLPQGKVLGGSTAINAMLYVRGNRQDYDGWRDLGNEGWGYDDVLPVFRAMERNERLAGPYHGTDGELNVADQIQHNPMSKAFLLAAQQVGIPYNPDPNGATQDGAFYHQVTQRDGYRESAATAFLRPAAGRPNLTVLTHATTTRVLVEGGRAVGVRYRRGGQEHEVRADGEVIVSAGAINSPRLLLLSGIGPAAELEAVGVTPVHDLPGVGKNLHDQLEVYITAQCREHISYSGQDRWDRATRHALQWALYKTGPATATITEVGAFIRSSVATDAPDIQLHFLPAYVVWPDEARAAARMPGSGITLLACDVRPASRGSVALASADPDAMPLVDPNYLSEARDWEVALEGFARMREALAAPAIARHLTREQLPGPEITREADIRAYIRRWGKTDYHPVGTCKMGRDDLAVVDPQLRVRGLEHLRVIDSSVMPRLISGNTQAPSMMIGEKGAAMILGEPSPAAVAGLARS